MGDKIYTILKLPNGKTLISKIKPPVKIKIVRGLFECKTYKDENR